MTLAKGLRIGRVLLSSQYAYMLEYRAEIALWALSGVVPFIMLALWSQLDSGAPGSQPLGLNQRQLSRYFLSVFVVRQFTIAWVVWAFEEDALQGRLSHALLQPLHPLWRYLSAHLAEQATRLPFVAALVGLFFVLQPGALWMPSLGQGLTALLAIWMAFAINFLLQSAIAILCFWSERASALERLLYIPYLFLSGLVAPLEVFPPAVRAFALWTPFPYMIAFPAQLLSGNPLSFHNAFAAMAAWIALLLPLVGLLWKAGVKRYGAMGA
jgi:ABC-2 type transport system permease protein